MRIPSVSYLSNHNRSMQRTYRNLASGKRVNTAADDATALAIASKLTSHVNGTNVGISNAREAQSMLNIADGAMGSVTDAMQRINELSIQAYNGTYSNSDRSAIQAEIDQLKESIGSITSQTKFNEMNVLDGSMGSTHVASNADGSGMNINMPQFSLKGLGIADYDISSGKYDENAVGNFNVSAIGNALGTVNAKRSYIGAAYNGLGHTISNHSNAAYNMTAGLRRIQDTDYAQGSMDLKKQQILNTYSIMMQRKLINNADGQVRMMLG